MSSVLFACSKCFSRHPFEELSAGQQLCKNCRGSSSVVKCTYCRTEYQPATKSQSACKKCEHCLSKYGKPNACECCKIVAAFGNSKCIRCATYEAKYGPPIQCDECKQRCAFDKRDENNKINGKLLCWLCTNSFKRALLKAQQEGRISAKKRPHEKMHRDSSTTLAKKSSRPSADIKSSSGGTGGGSSTAIAASGGESTEKINRTGSGGSGGSGGGNGSSMGLGSIAAPAVITIDPNSSDHVVAMTNLKERIASLERRLQQKDKELLEKDKLLTELKGKNFEKEIEMRNRLKEVDRLHVMKVENLNRKVSSLLKELAVVKKSTKKNGTSGGSNIKERQIEREKRENISPKEELVEEEQQGEKEIMAEVEKVESKSDDEQENEEKGSVGSGSNSPSTN